jgi:hypothetical protein
LFGIVLYRISNDPFNIISFINSWYSTFVIFEKKMSATDQVL